METGPWTYCVCSQGYPLQGSKTAIKYISFTSNTGLKAALDTKKKRKKKKYMLDFGEPREDTGDAMFFTLSKVKEAQFIQRMKEQDQEAETLRKAEAKQNKAKATALKKKEKEEIKVARKEAKKLRQAKASELAAARAQKEAEAIAAKAQKAANLSTKCLSILSQNSRARPKSKRGALQLQGGEDHGEGPSEPAPKASRTRTIRAPKRYSE
jgi:alanyl-tRNA synthetase